MVNSKTYGFSEDFEITARTDNELEQLQALKQRQQVEFHVEKFVKKFPFADDNAENKSAQADNPEKVQARLDGGLLLLCLSRPSFGVGRKSLNSLLANHPEILSEEKMSGTLALTKEDAVEVLLLCASTDENFYKSLHRRLPRISTKMHEQYEWYIAKRNMLQNVFNAIDRDGGGSVDQKELEQFFGITGGTGRELKYSEAQLALMTDEDKELLLKTDDLTSNMDISGDGVLTFSEFMRFFLGNNPDVSPEELQGNLQDLGFLQEGKPRRFAPPDTAEAQPLPEEQEQALLNQLVGGAHEALEERQGDLLEEMAQGAHEELEHREEANSNDQKEVVGAEEEQVSAEAGEVAVQNAEEAVAEIAEGVEGAEGQVQLEAESEEAAAELEQEPEA